MKFFIHFQRSIAVYLLVILSLINIPVHAEFIAKDQWSRSTVNGVADAKEAVIKIIGLSADVDLYVRKGQQPSLQAYDCRPALQGTLDETCVIPLSNGETVNVGVYGAEAGEFFLDISYRSFVPAANEPVPLILGRKTAGSVASNQFKYFVVDSSKLPALSDEFLLPSAENHQGFGVELVAKLTELSADADLYIGIGEFPTTNNGVDQCFTKPGGTDNEQCGVFLKDLKDRPVYIGINGFNSDASFNVQAMIQKTINVAPGDIPIVGNGFTATTTVLKDHWNYYQVNANQVATAKSISITMTPKSSDVDLYVRTQAPPIALHWDCFANKAGTIVEVCTKNNPDPNQSFYFGVFGFTSSEYTVAVAIQQ